MAPPTCEATPLFSHWTGILLNFIDLGFQLRRIQVHYLIQKLPGRKRIQVHI